MNFRLFTINPILIISDFSRIFDLELFETNRGFFSKLIYSINSIYSWIFINCENSSMHTPSFLFSINYLITSSNYLSIYLSIQIYLSVHPNLSIYLKLLLRVLDWIDSWESWIVRTLEHVTPLTYKLLREQKQNPAVDAKTFLLRFDYDYLISNARYPKNSSYNN